MLSWSDDVRIIRLSQSTALSDIRKNLKAHGFESKIKQVQLESSSSHKITKNIERISISSATIDEIISAHSKRIKSSSTPITDPYSMLIYACKYGHSDLLSALIAKDAETCKHDSNLTTPLIHCLLNNQLECAEVLLESETNKQSSVNLTDKTGRTALIIATTKKMIDACMLLSSHGAEVDLCVNTDAVTPLSIACSSNSVEIAELLLNHGADINHINCNGQTH